MTERQARTIFNALFQWADRKGMKPIKSYIIKRSPGNCEIAVSLSEEFNSDPSAPNVDYIVWNLTHPGSVTGYQHQVFRGKSKPQVRGGWVDFIYPKGE